MHLKTAKLALMGLALSTAAATAQDVYVSDGPSNQPWGSGDFENAMSTVFGTYQNDSYTQAGTSIFTSANKFIFIQGGDGNGGDFDAYMNNPALITAMQNWVAGGGSLYIDAARWPAGDGLDTLGLGFGINLLTTDTYGYASYSGVAAGPSPIFTPATGTSWSGNYVSHDIVTGGSLSPLIYTSSGAMSLAQESYGAGHVIVGGLTAPEFQSTGGYPLLDNILAYGASQASAPDSGATLSLLGAGMGALGMFRRFVSRKA